MSIIANEMPMFTDTGLPAHERPCKLWHCFYVGSFWTSILDLFCDIRFLCWNSLKRYFTKWITHIDADVLVPRFPETSVHHRICHCHVQPLTAKQLYSGQLFAAFTLEDEQIVWTDKSSQTDKSSDVATGRTNLSVCKDVFFLRRLVRPDEQVNQSPT